MTVNNTIAHQRLILSGDRERFKELLRRRLIECGWRDQIRMVCREIVKEHDSNSITLDMLVARVTPRARALVPDPVKKELLQKIKTHLLTQKNL
ncbi:enhancer of yellow 2 transcription factor-like [Pararge aegeria]|uniref:Enhancer of yellow 2 transcription factor n=3 Tax=Satyrini TaxID=127320 RepID=A0A8S4RZJ4_9NEOP|nr:enhancer of yellow 2 transcription factor [Bicyclus anynana]XP_039765277.1 enhancer of yellow 2 transcription factor-like [Pararge aegeria]CAH2243436.1 jg9352 [Pararge aegeria aegeria]